MDDQNLESNRSQQKRRIDEIMPQQDCAQMALDTKRKSPKLFPDVTEWLTSFENMPESLQLEALTSLIPLCKQSQIRHLHNTIAPYFQVDFLRLLPRELSMKILGYLPPENLVVAASISRAWNILAEDNGLWVKKCRQYAIKELFPPCLARRENWALVSEGLVNSPRGSPFQLKPDMPDSPSKLTSSSSARVLSPVVPTPSLAPCLERSRWKAVYLRNQRISNNWRHSRYASCHLKGHDEHVITCLKLRGALVVTGSDDCTLRVWSVATGQCTQVLTGHTGGVWALQLSEDGKLAMSGSTDRTVRVWNTESGELVHCLQGHTSTVRCMSLRGKLLVSGSRDCTIRMWDVEAGCCLRPFIGHLAAVRCVKFDGQTIVSGAYDYKIHVWNGEEGTLSHVLEGHTNRVYSIHFVSERSLVISGSLDTTIRVWNVKTGECLQLLVGHQSLTSGMKLRGNWLVSANADSTIKVWNILDGTCVHTLAGPNKHASAVTGLRFLENGLVATSGDDGTVKLWNIDEGTFVCDLVKLASSGAGGCVWRMKATPTLLVCAVGSRNGTEDTKLILMDFDAPYP